MPLLAGAIQYIMTEEKIIESLQTQEAQDVKTLIAYAVRKSATLKDDEILANADKYAELIAANLKEIASQSPTDKEAKAAGMRILKALAAQTKTPWDDAVLKVIDWVV